MGNCFNNSKFSKDGENLIKPFIRTDMMYELRFDFQDLALNPLVKFDETRYSIVFLFSKTEFVDTFIYKKTNHDEKVYKERIRPESDNLYFYEKTEHFVSMYYNLETVRTFPSLNFIKKINDRALTEMYNVLIYENF